MKLFRIARFSAVPAVLSFALLSGHAQAPQSAPGTPAKPSAQPQLNAPVLVTMFEGDLNSKKAQAGHEVTAKVVKDLKLGDLDIPKGSKLVGKVALAVPEHVGKGRSSLDIQFDKIEMPGNREMKIRGLIVALGKVGASQGLGYTGTVLSRGGAGSTVGLDPNWSAGQTARDDIPPGSSMPGVALGMRLDPTGASQLRGVDTDIHLDSSTMMKIALFRPAQK